MKQPDKLRESALEYHRNPKPGKIRVTPTKALTTQKDLSLAYSPGVAAASELIHADPAEARNMTARANLVGVITNGTAVLGLGDIGPLAAKPVMEGKGVLFKKFSDIDVFDIEIDEGDPDKLVDIIAASLEPTFGGINLEDIKAPECLRGRGKTPRKRLNIPVFHDDQHGTAIITAAAVINGLDDRGQGDRKSVLADDFGRRRRRDGLSRPAGQARPSQGKHPGHRPRRRDLRRARDEYMDDSKAGYAQETDMRNTGRSRSKAPTYSWAFRSVVCSPATW